jgi:hypothetical protein
MKELLRLIQLMILKHSIIPTTDLSFANMQSFEDDGINTYDLNPIKTPAGLFKDGAPYSVCHICSTIARCWI